MTDLFSTASYISLAIAGLSPLVYGLLCLRVSNADFQPVFAEAFAIGLAITFVAYITETTIDVPALVPSGQAHLLFGLLTLVALPEEMVKLAGLKAITDARRSGRLEGLLVASFIGGGFAAGENLVYVANLGSGVIFIRFLTATAFHTFNTIILARIYTSPHVQNRSVNTLLALSVSVAIHGIYDFSVIETPRSGAQFVFILAMAVSFGLGTLRTFALRPEAINENKID